MLSQPVKIRPESSNAVMGLSESNFIFLPLNG